MAITSLQFRTKNKITIRIFFNYNWKIINVSPTELRIAADMEDSVTEFLQKKFGDPLRLPESGNRLIYKPFYLPEEFRLEVA